MGVSVAADALAVASHSESLGFAKLLLLRRSTSFISLSDCSSAGGPSPCSSASPLHVAALMNPVDAVAPPPVKSDPYRALTRALLRRRRRTKRRLLRPAGCPGEGDDGSVYGDGFGDGPFGGGGGDGGGGQGWNFNGFGGQSWDDWSRRQFAFDFIYEVIYWIALSKCIHFAFKRVARIMAEMMIEDVQRKKVPVRLTAIC